MLCYNRIDVSEGIDVNPLMLGGYKKVTHT